MKIDQIINQDYHAFFAPEDCDSDLKRQLKGKIWSQGRLFLASPKQSSLYFLQNRWEQPRILKYRNLKDLEQILKSFEVPFFFQSFGKRITHFQVPTPEIKFLESAKPFRFLEWTILDDSYLMVCEKHGQYPLNEFRFQEDRQAPSRAYLKLWELFTRIDKCPKKGEICLELGSAPGGWTYVLDKLECQINSVDRAELEVSSPRIHHRKMDAFSVLPGEFSKLDWFFSDIICLPSKLAEFVQVWMESGVVENFVCTLKFKGSTDWESIRLFEKMGGELVHLNHNKHELTWYRIQ